MGDMKDRVLLVQIISADQFPGQTSSKFPAFKGYLEAKGVPVAWLRFGVPSDNQFRHGRDEITLEASELALLERRIKELRPNAVLTSHPLFSKQRRRLERLCGSRLEVWRDDSPLGVELLRRAGHPTGLIRDSTFEYHGNYRWEAGNPAAERPDRNNVYLDTLSDCGYFKPAAANPLYAEVEFPPGADTYGCSFCGWFKSPRPAGTRAVRSFVSRQLSEIKRTLGPDRLPGAVMVENIVQPGLLEFVLRELRRLGMSKTVLLAAARVDHLVGLRRSLEATLAGLRRRGESLHIHTTGIENFSDPELMRFNKGFDSLTALRGVNLLKELEVLYPRHFHFSGYMPLGFILFSPWTRLEDLRRNLRLIQHLELEREAGNLFMSRLRLHPNRAITALAAKDGLLADTVESSLRLNRRKFFGFERPWRFADPRLESVNRVATRLEHNGSFDDDPLYERIRSGLLDADRRQLVAVMLCLVEAASRHGEPRSPEDLLEEALALWKEPPPRGRRGPAERRLGLELLPAAELVLRLLLVLDRGKPALSIEGLDAAALAAIDLPALAARGVFAVAAGSGEERTLYLSRRRSTVNRLSREHAKARGGSSSAAARAGRLLGYPACCVRAWARRGAPTDGLDAWSLNAWRQRAGARRARAQPLLSADLRFLPCAPGCRRAGAAYSRWLSGAGVTDAPWDRAFLFGLEDDRELASVAVLNDNPRELRYDPARVDGVPGRLRSALERGDRVLLLPGQVEVRRGGLPVACWVAEVAVWDARAGLDAEFWGELAKAAARRKDPQWRRRSAEAARIGQGLALDRPAALGRTSATEPPGPEPLDQASGKLRFLLESAVRAFPERFKDIKVAGVRAAAGPAIDVELRIGSLECRLRLIGRGASPRWLLQTEHFAVICDPRTPVSSDMAVGRLAPLLRLYGEALRRHAPRLMPGILAPSA